MSPRAAWWLDSPGFREICDYVAGKSGWMAAGLPIESDEAALPRARDAADAGVPTRGLGDRLGDVRARVVLGRLRGCLRPPRRHAG